MLTRFSLSCCAIAALALIAVMLSGCSGGSSSSSAASSAAMTISAYPTTAQSLAPGAVAVLAAYVNNDSNGAGVSWTLSGPGALSNATNSAPAVNTVNTITYKAGAPTSVSVATVTATSVANTALSVSFTINLQQSLSITTASPLPGGKLNTAYSTTLAATGGVGPYAYTQTSGFLPAGVTLSSTGVISGTPTVVGAFTFTVRATDTTGLTASQTFTLTITGPLTILSGTSATGEIGLPFRFAQTATGGITPYTWSTTQGTLPAGLSLNTTTGAITGTPTGTANTTTVTETLTDSAGTAVSHVVTIVLAAAATNTNNAELNGTYAFLLSGFDAAGNPLAAVGSLTANGAGAVTGGSIDLNGGTLTAAQTNVALSASAYTVGGDNRGRITLTTAAASYTFTLALNGISGGKAGGGFLTEFDTSGQQLTGTLALRDTTSFSTASVTGGYAFGLAGFAGNATTHAGAVGEMQLSAASLTGGELLESTRGGAPLTIASGSYTMSAAGRGTFALSLVDGSSPINLIAYPVSAKLLYLLSADPVGPTAPLLSGQATQQTILNGNFAAASLNGTAVTILSRTLGATANAANSAQVAVGLYTFDGKGDSSLLSDMNSIGTVTSTTTSGVYTVAINGRVKITTATGQGGCVSCQVPQVVVYLSGANQGYALDLLTGIGTGSLVSQTQSAFTAASLNGAYAVGTAEPPMPAAFTSGVLTANGAGTVSATLDNASPAMLAPDTAVTYTATGTSNGRTILKGSDGSNEVLYLISPAAGVLLNLSNTSPTAQSVQQ